MVDLSANIFGQKGSFPPNQAALCRYFGNCVISIINQYANSKLNCEVFLMGEYVYVYV